jgi:hypothetical protein
MRVYSKIRKMWCSFPNNGYTPLLKTATENINFRADNTIDADLLTSIVDYLETHGSESLYYLITNNK